MAFKALQWLTLFSPLLLSVPPLYLPHTNLLLILLGVFLYISSCYPKMSFPTSLLAKIYSSF